MPLVPVNVSGYVPAAVEAVVQILNVDEPEPVTVAGLKLELAPLGSPLRLKDTLSLKPLLGLTVIASLPQLPAATVTEEDDCESAKSVTASVTVALWLVLPLVAVMVSVLLAAGVVLLVLTLIVVEPEPVTVVGLKLAPAPAGSPFTLKETLPAKQFCALTVAV